MSSWEIIEVSEMGIDQIVQGKHIGKNRDNTCSCTCAHTQDDKGREVRTFSHNDTILYFFSKEEEGREDCASEA